MVQIHTGPVTTLKQVGPWFNVLDPGFNLHLRDGDITEAWVVRKPTRDGIVTALEVYDAEGRQIAQMLGERHDGEKALADWRNLLETLAPEGVAEIGRAVGMERVGQEGLVAVVAGNLQKNQI